MGLGGFNGFDGFGGRLNDVVEEASDGKGADATSYRGDGGEVLAFADFRGEVAFDDAIFAGSASVDKNGAGADAIIRNQAGDAGCAYDYIKVLKICQVVAAVKEGDVVI